MDRISLLPNDFILHILSLLPTKDVLSTSVLSKRWRNLWKLVPKLEYIDCDKNADQGKFVRFVDRSLLLSTAPVLESLHFKLDKQCSEVDDVFWVETAVEQGLRELNFDYHYMINEPMRLPQSLFTCGTLMVLKLKNVSLVNVQFPVCFRLLKRLHLEYVNFLDDESPKKLLSSCPVLEVFDLDRAENNNVETFSVMVPTLQRFTYAALSDSELVMNTPSLKFFKTFDHSCECMIEYMPEIVEAHVQIHGGTIVSRGPIYHWNEPRSVPETLSFVLETFEWRNYRGWKIEREIATFILKHARRLKIATFSPADPTEVRMELRTTLGMKYRMLMDLARLCFVNISFCIKRSMCNYRRMIELN